MFFFFTYTHLLSQSESTTKLFSITISGPDLHARVYNLQKDREPGHEELHT